MVQQLIQHRLGLAAQLSGAREPLANLERLARGAVHADVAGGPLLAWRAAVSDPAGGDVDLGASGLRARTGLYVADRTAGGGGGVLTVADLAAGKPLLLALPRTTSALAAASSCAEPTSCSGGLWYSPVCFNGTAKGDVQTPQAADGRGCRLLLHTRAADHRGVLEQIVTNAKLPLVIAYVGAARLSKEVLGRAALNLSTAFLGRTPSALVGAEGSFSNVTLTRLSLKAWDAGCKAKYLNLSGSTVGAFNCDFPPAAPLHKLAHSTVQAALPDLWRLLQRFTLSGAEVVAMLSELPAAPSAAQIDDAACRRLAATQDAWSDWVPRQVARPSGSGFRMTAVPLLVYGSYIFFRTYESVYTPLADAPAATMAATGGLGLVLWTLASTWSAQLDVSLCVGGPFLLVTSCLLLFVPLAIGGQKTISRRPMSEFQVLLCGELAILVGWTLFDGMRVATVWTGPEHAQWQAMCDSDHYSLYVSILVAYNAAIVVVATWVMVNKQLEKKDRRRQSLPIHGKLSLLRVVLLSGIMFVAACTVPVMLVFQLDLEAAASWYHAVACSVVLATFLVLHLGIYYFDPHLDRAAAQHHGADALGQFGSQLSLLSNDGDKSPGTVHAAAAADAQWRARSDALKIPIIVLACVPIVVCFGDRRNTLACLVVACVFYVAHCVVFKVRMWMLESAKNNSESTDGDGSGKLLVAAPTASASETNFSDDTFQVVVLMFWMTSPILGLYLIEPVADISGGRGPRDSSSRFWARGSLPALYDHFELMLLWCVVGMFCRAVWKYDKPIKGLIFSFRTFWDVVSIYIWVLLWAAPASGPVLLYDLHSADPFLCMVISGVVRLFRLRDVTAYSKLYYFQSSKASAKFELLELIASLFQILFSMAMTMFVLENQSNFGFSLHDFVYFAIVTCSTVGYGDVDITSPLTRMYLCITIAYFVSFVPPRLRRLAELYSKKKTVGTLPEGADGKEKQLVVIVADVDEDTVDEFLTEFYHADHGEKALKTKSVILAVNNDDEHMNRMQNILKKKRWKGKASYVAGDVIDEDDLDIANASAASAYFLISASNASNPAEEDRRTVSHALALMPKLPTKKREEVLLKQQVFVKLLKSDGNNTRYLVEAGFNRTVCVEEMKGKLIAKSCACPGLSTIICNLVHSDVDFEPTKNWHQDYSDGAGCEIYSLKVPGALLHTPFLTAAFALYAEYEVLLFAVKITLDGDNDFLAINPGNRHQLAADDILYVIADDKDAADSARDGITLEIVRSTAEIQAMLSSGSMSPRDHEQSYLDQVFASVMSTRGVLSPRGGPSPRADDEFGMSPRSGSESPAPRKKEEKKKKKLYRSKELWDSDVTRKQNGLEPEWFVTGGTPCCPVCAAPVRACCCQIPASCDDGVLWGRSLDDDSSVVDGNGDDCIVKNISGHIVVSASNSLSILFNFILPLRSRVQKSCQPIVVIVPDKSAFKEVFMTQLKYFEKLYVVYGEPTDHSAMESARVGHANRIVWFTDPHGSGTREGTQDKESLMKLCASRTLLEESENSWTPTLFDMTEFVSVDGFSLVAPAKHHVSNPLYASGRIFASSIFDTLLVQAYYNPALLELLEELVCGANAHIFEGVQSAIAQIDVPQELMERVGGSATYRDLAAYLMLEKDTVPLGLYRLLDETSVANRPHADREQLRYVFTKPASSCAISPRDKIFVLQLRNQGGA